MARAPSATSRELLFNKLHQFDQPGLFGLNYQLPEYVKSNLKDNLRPYQEEALRYFHYSQFRQDIADRDYKHVLFNMATGSGKTMVMAATILYMFKEYGYQNFIFFVHTDAIIQKTKENLLNTLSSKYLFTQSLEIEGERIVIESVDTFPRQPSKNTIYLKLSTIHKIHDEINKPKENSITLEDLAEIPLVLLGDEAHHFNAETRNRATLTTQERETLSWERTIEQILALQEKNRLLELGTVEHAKLKSVFKNSDFYKSGQLFFNEVEEILGHERSWTSYSLEKQYEISYKTANEVGLDNLAATSNAPVHIQTLQLDRRYWFKALQKIRFFEFSNLKHYFPNLSSVEEFLSDSQYLGSLIINVNLPSTLDLNNLPPSEKLQLLETVLTRISENIRRNYQKYRGTHRFISKPLKDVIMDYSVHVDPSMMVNQRITSESTIGKTWYVYDKAILNQLEHRMIKLLDMFMEKLRGKYNDIYVIRNDEKTTRFKLTEFDGVRGFMPDFIMLMKDKAETNVYYQVFLEPKGDDRLIQDAWKERMLADINDPSLIVVDSDEDVRLVGIKFFADSQRQAFHEDFSEKLYDGQPLEAQSLIMNL